MSNSSGITTSIWRLVAILNFVKKGCATQGKLWDSLQVLKDYILVIYRFKSLYVSYMYIRAGALGFPVSAVFKETKIVSSPSTCES